MVKKYKNNLGFTLVELLAVLIIISVLFLLVSPKVLSIINNNRKKGYYEIERRLEEAAAKYILNEPVDLNSPKITITKDELISSDYIEEIYDLNDNTICDAFVEVTNLTGIAEFDVFLMCSSYDSKE